MKKILLMFICLTLFAGCSQNKTTTNDSNQDKVYTGTSDPNNDTADDQNDWYGRFESGLKDKNITYSNRTSLDASSIGGVEGYRYTTDNGHIDVYKFEDGDEFNKIVKEKKISLNGTDSYNVEVNDHMIIVSDGLSEDVLSVFRGLK